MNINDILTRFRTDPEFAAKYRNLNDINAVQSQLKSDGYDVSLDNIRAGIGQLQGASGEISESDLAGVAGGGASMQDCPKCGSKNCVMVDYSGGITTWECYDCGYTERQRR